MCANIDFIQLIKLFASLAKAHRKLPAHHQRHLRCNSLSKPKSLHRPQPGLADCYDPCVGLLKQNGVFFLFLYKVILYLEYGNLCFCLSTRENRMNLFNRNILFIIQCCIIVCDTIYNSMIISYIFYFIVYSMISIYN